MAIRHSWPVLVVLFCSPHSVTAAPKVTLENLLRQMTDVSALAEFPDPPFVTRQFSSYDRVSQTPTDADGWFANADRGFTLYVGVLRSRTPYFKSGPQQGRKPDGYFEAGTRVGIAPTHKPAGGYVWAYTTAPDGGPIKGRIPQGYVAKANITMNPEGPVLAEMDGPGCVVRIWSANPQDAGNIRIYLDGARQPAITAPLQQFLGGKWETQQGVKKWTPFPDPLACERSRGWNLYFPIPYARHCKVCVDKADIYYHVDYRTYPKGTQVETFRLADSQKLEAKITAVADTLTKGLEDVPRAEPGPLRSLQPGEKLTWSARGPAAVVDLTATVGKIRDKADALRGLVLVGRFDGAAEPQVWCPLGDFFGSSPGFNAYDSLPFHVGPVPGGKGAMLFESLWRMPFEKSAVFELHNLGTRPVQAALAASTRPYRWTDRSMHFHAKWRTESFKTRPFRDWNFCDLQGKGVFVGDMLSILNPVSAWWGEGDEKIYVDGERFPSWFGTGTEDYFGYAWSDPHQFQHAYHNQTRCDGPGTFGRTSVNRFHVLDCIPFTKSFRFDMEVWHWTPTIEVNYAATSYWYARPGGTDRFKPADAEVLRHLPMPPPPYKIAGAIEGEQMKLLAVSGPFEIDPQVMEEFPDGKWSGDAQLWARPKKAGDWVDLRLPVPADGRYHVVVYLTKAPDYGIIRFLLGGKPLGKPIDGYNPKVVSSGPIDLGAADLKKGGATLRVQVTGTNPRSVGVRHMWGLDCVVLRPAGK
jgi:hypothetical protein